MNAGKFTANFKLASIVFVQTKRPADVLCHV